ncbi:hypothetical protein SCG7086_AB_00060 [Chlamydiales bacterium SCGC AG-110-P3]|nr:hypothetical protein SCG7086_AB_00060 [Chlamydiales bacterium SCGC AG-110-P3]
MVRLMIKELFNRVLQRDRKKTPTVIQMEHAECGAAALSIIMGYYGRFTPLEELRIACGVSRDGCDAYNLIEAAKFHGMEGAGYEADIASLEHEAKLPCILYWNSNHFIVLEGFSGNRIYINDPATGPRTITREQFEKAYSNIVIILEPGPGFKKADEPKRLIDALKSRLLKTRMRPLYFILSAQLSLVLIGLTSPAARQVFLDNILSRGMYDWKGGLLSFMGIIATLTITLSLLRATVLNRLRSKLSVCFSAEFIWHILQLPTRFFTQRHGAKVIQRMGLNDSVSSALTSQLLVTAVNIVLIMIYGLVMITYDVPITLLAIGSTASHLLLLRWISRARMDAYTRLQQNEAQMTGVAIDSLQNIQSLKAVRAEPFLFSRVLGHYTQNINNHQRIGRKDVFLTTGASLAEGLSSAALLGFRCWRAIHGSLTVGMLIGFQMLLVSFTRPFFQLVSFGTNLQALRMDLMRLDDVLANKIDKRGLEIPPMNGQDFWRREMNLN